MCGAIAFTWHGKPRFVGDCVCESCRRAHGASAVAWFGGPAEQFSIDQGESELHWYQSSVESERGFCQSCGTRFLFRSSKWPNEIHVAVANLHAPHDLVSGGVAFKDELPDWTAMKIKT